MPKVGAIVKKAVQSAKLSWEVEEAIAASPYRHGRLKCGKSVIGELTVLKPEFKRMAAIFKETKFIEVKEEAPRAKPKSS